MLEPVCTASSLSAEEPLTGSAPHTRAWVCLEQSGPWGAKAWTSSHLDPELGAAIEGRAAGARVRPSLIRRPGPHPDDPRHASRALLVAHTHPDNSWLLTAQISDPSLLLDLDWAAAAQGDLQSVQDSLPLLTRSHTPRLLICTNGRRDTCCARLGRPVAAAALAAAADPDRVWEVTHTSGHRFAPTTVLLPSGQLHGRVSSAAELLGMAESGELALEGLRGRSSWPAAGQAAEIWVRRREQITGIDVLTLAEGESHWQVNHRDGRDWAVKVTERRLGERSTSCGQTPEPVVRYDCALY